MTTEERLQAFPVLAQLRTHLTPETFLVSLAEMAADGYRMFAASYDGQIKGVAGISIGRNFYYGRYMWVYDLVTDDSHRSRGVGAALLSHLEEVARDAGCDTLALSSGLQRADAHRFYEDKMGYERFSYTFSKKLG